MTKRKYFFRSLRNLMALSAPRTGYRSPELHSVGHALAHRHRIRRFALQETPRHGQLRAQHVSLQHSGERSASADLDAIGGIMQKYAGSVRHGRGGYRAARHFRLLHAPQ